MSGCIWSTVFPCGMDRLNTKLDGKTTLDFIERRIKDTNVELELFVIASMAFNFKTTEVDGRRTGATRTVSQWWGRERGSPAVARMT